MNPLLESILKASAEGAMQQQRGQSGQAASDPIADLLGGILGGGAAPQQQAAPQAQNPIADILGGILGGGAQQAAPRRQPAPAGGSDMIGDLIGGLIGGNASQGQPHQNGIADMIGAIMGGGSGARSGGAGNNIIANMLAEKLGIPPALASAAVAFFMAKMFQRQMTKQQQPSGTGGIFEQRRQQAEPDDSLDLDDLLDSMGDGNALGMKFSNSGMASDLAKQTGMSADQANKALQEIVNIVGQQRTRPRPVTPKGANLKGLLDNWD